MKSYKVLLFSVVLVLFVCPQLQAQNQTITLYVNATTGIDVPSRAPVAARPFKTIGYALHQIPALRSSSDVQAVINISAGVYNESIIVDQNNIWLKAAGSDVTSVVGDGASTVLQIIGPIKSHITGFTIQNGGVGLYSSFASVVVENCVITNNAGYAGIEVLDASLMNLINTNVNNNQVGISVYRNATAVIDFCNIFGNSSIGLEVWWSANARIMNNCAIYSNGSYGIQIGGASSVRMSTSAVHDNTLSGILAFQTGTFGSRGGNTIYANAVSGGAGVQAGNGSSVYFSLTDTQVKDAIYNNNGPGLSIRNNSSLNMEAADVHNNQGDGVALSLGSSGTAGSGVSITDNAGYGVSCSDGSVASGSPGDVSGNSSGITNCE
jgi:hypothetical protein